MRQTRRPRLSGLPLGQRAAVVVAGPLANLLLAVLLYAGAHWIGTEEPKALLSPPSASSLAERAGLRSRDWVRAASRDGNEWTDLRSMNDLRWQVTQAATQRQRLDRALRALRGIVAHGRAVY